jgi:hypothetical protein
MTSRKLADVPATPGLSAADAEQLAALIADAKDRQARALRDAIDGGMGHIPKLLRGPIKALLFR